MPPSTRIPPLLQPFIHLPRDDSLLLLTSTLGASANWLIIRFLCNALSDSNAQDGGDEGPNVVLASWMREYEFWKQEARKGAGLDLEKLREDGRFAFVDGLSGVGSEATKDGNLGSGEQRLEAAGFRNTSMLSTKVSQVLPVRGPPGRLVPARGPTAPAAPVAQNDPMASVAPAEARSTNQSARGHHTLKNADLAYLRTTISTAVSSLTSPSPPASTTSSISQRKTLIILDNPDLLLALNPTVTSSTFTSLILALHTLPTVSHILTHLQSDTPLLSLSTPPQPLELAHNNLLVKCAHMSRRILGVRVLDTGVARDVSGVVRVTEQKADWLGLGFESEGKESEDSGKGREFLYQVKGDGSVRVFERGAGGEG
ncbi:Nn.00g033900.m01.CDS01 [Neocucurbitaria sp. VM-36]